MMRRLVQLTLVAVLALPATACQAPTPEPATATGPKAEATKPAYAAFANMDFMGTREEREARAPYTPTWWPYEVGDTVTFQRGYYLAMAAEWNGLGSVFWVDTLAFVPVFRTVWPEDSPVPTGETYEGHFPRKSRHPPDEWWDDWPDHLTGQDSADVKRWLYDPDRSRGVRGASSAEMLTWTRERWLEGWRGPGTGEGDDR